MEEFYARVERAALLHDIGKLVLRARPERRTHSAVGVSFLETFVAGEHKDILRAVGHHHGADLKSLSPAADDMSYIVYEADNLAAGSDRRAIEGAEGGFSSKLPLSSVFNVFGGTRRNQSFYLRPLREESALLYPVESSRVSTTQATYQDLLDIVETNFRQCSPFSMGMGDLLRVLEAALSYVPSSTATAEAADISLYDHLKLTAAFAAAMVRYYAEKGITDYRSATLGARAKEFRETDMFLLASGDLSGIQSFLYTIPSRHAARSLRGRSAYMEILLEHIADEILSRLGLSRASLLYTGGGHFYMLLPNTEEARRILAEARERINDWMLENFASRLYLALAWTPCRAQEFLAEGTGIRGAFHRVGEALGEEKLRRYSEAQLARLFDPESDCNRTREGDRECAVCHTSTRELVEEDGRDVCPMCLGLEALGSRLVEKDILCVLNQAEEGALSLPSLAEGEAYLTVESKKSAEQRAEHLRRMYVKNRDLTGEALATHIWVGDYAARAEKGGLLELSELAAGASGLAPGRGISRLGVLRADVDNLGAAFLAGFSQEMATLSRTATLSRQLSLFFKRYINGICAGEVNGIGDQEEQPFSLFGTEKGARRVHIIYSGGDDLFLVGAWDEILELAVDLYRAFARFTGGALHFSAGVGMFRATHPVADMARKTGELEDAAKAIPGKNGVALFGTSPEASRVEAYSWPDFIDGVCGEKLDFLLSHFQLEGIERLQGEGRLRLGKSALYRMLRLLAKEGPMQLARFAYVLARLEPDKKAPEPQKKAYREVRERFYTWYRSAKDRRELLTAVELLIYGLREKEEKAG